MNYIKVFKAIEEEFDSEIALMVIQILTVSQEAFNKRRPKYLSEPQKYLRNSFKDIFWEQPEEKQSIVWNLFNTVYDWCIAQEMQGLGGCEVKAFKELLAKNPE